MDASTPIPTADEPTPAEQPTAPAPPRLWRGDHATGAVGRGRRGPIVPVAVVLVALVAAIALLISWVRPAPVLDVVPLWEVESLQRPDSFPSVPQGVGDRRAFTDPT